MKKRLFSGIQPTGEVHIGNYLGAIKKWVELLDTYDSFFSIVDYHALTISYDPKEMSNLVIKTAMVNMAAGLDLNRACMFIQSHVPEHTELTWFFNTVTPINYLERMIQFKEKSAQHTDNINAGLFCYPVLQAADILIYKAEVVPVGEDQFQHLELTRDIARFFNRAYGDTFPEPKAIEGFARKIIGLDGKNKMSKSLNNYIALLDPPDVIKQKLKTAVTDENRKRRADPGDPDICNLFSLHKYFSSSDEINEINTSCRNASIGCIQCKEILAKNIIEELMPIQNRYNELSSDIKSVKESLYESAAKARKIAQSTINEIKEKMGLVY